MTTVHITALEQLRHQLGVIGDAWPTLLLALTWAARDLHRLLERADELRARSFQAGQRSESTRHWVCLPLEYPRFCSVEGEHGRQPRPPDIDEHPLWREGLLRVVAAAATPTVVEPVVPIYAAYPFLVIQTMGPPGLDRVFDSRYFMVSTELNLLNSVLFVADGGEAGIGQHHCQ